jgi:carboxypeptidase Taq
MTTSTNTAYEALTRHFARMSSLRGAQAILGWDMQTMMPKGGAESRGQQLATLEGLSHELMTDPRVGGWLDQAEAGSASLGAWEAANVREMRRAWRHATAVEGSLVESLAVAGARCTAVWREARPKNDFAAYAPLQAEVMGLVREVAAQKASAFGVSPYDALIDQYEPGMTAARVEVLFAPLRARLPGIIAEALERQGSPAAPATGSFPTAAQKSLGLRVMEALGFDFTHGRLDVSAHPFCGGTPADVRMTTRYREDTWQPAFHGIVHETGHGLYEQGLPVAWRDQPVGEARGMGVHESQSLFWEMQVARSPGFLRWVAPLVSEAFAAPVDAGALTRVAHVVRRGFIRVDADECTYPAHVMLRFELEQRLVAGTLAVADLPEAWREAMGRHLGVTPPDDRDGCMQDVHWTDGAVGYFPSYTLGAMIAAQLAEGLRRDLGDPSDLAARGDFAPMLSWLRTRIHGEASRLETDALVAQATSSELSAAAFLAHLERRYLGR